METVDPGLLEKFCMISAGTSFSMPDESCGFSPKGDGMGWVGWDVVVGED